MYKIKVYNKNGIRQDVTKPYDAGFNSYDAAMRYVDYVARFGQYCIVEIEREEVR